MDQLSSLNSAPLYLIIFTGLVSGLAGSLHCVGMCGGLVTSLTRSKKEVASYHIGRLLGYLTLGVILPTIGIEALNLRGNQNLALFAGLSLGLTFIFIGAKSFFNFKFQNPFHSKIEKLNQSIWRGLFTHFKKVDLLRSFLGGSASVLLPCGLLWSVIILSLSATNPFYALAFIISFWLGTTPALSVTPTLITKVFLPLKQRLPNTIPIFFILIGVITISSRFYMLYHQAGAHSCH